ncbi:DUF2752 domain-containing protein [Mucilaginibacter sp. BJC16-A38]|uniref:DUF2752 domain-containing protein n=1 Tax=Mucilaginibacter phenanthrenivorans TaxID=1234842 RepID=UPI0021577592|nr:DUF2752 domain-containing protein [Mucilaginibacter phenanthrenivorans]MCR8558430.1 DUF2752 domain-containing protein [Mucilaginibacter phenanthrenivorans]
MTFSRGLYFAIALFVTIGLIYYYYDPAKYGLFPKCPFYVITGLNCPGCGSQRAIHSLLNGNFKEAAGYNILLIISLPFLFIHFFYKIKSFIQKKDLRWKVIYHPLTPKVIFLVVVIFWIARNIPVPPFSYLSAGH